MLHLYRQMANILLQLSQLSFHRIGSLTEDTEGHYALSNRPLIPLMNTISSRIGPDSEVLPSCTYSTSKKRYCALAATHLTPLVCESNNDIRDKDDGRDTYIARKPSRKLAYDGRLTLSLGEEKSNPTFHIYSDDLCRTNVPRPFRNECAKAGGPRRGVSIPYAARNDRAFDYLYCKYLDSRFFGPNEHQNHGQGSAFSLRRRSR
ncbi:hypothetical protein F5B17DRAFT_56650 [Nemania serpens]|nr:hypothetical protein F5B17DRAFT_56650 [Nemania serpens]